MNLKKKLTLIFYCKYVGKYTTHILVLLIKKLNFQSKYFKLL